MFKISVCSVFIFIVVLMVFEVAILYCGYYTLISHMYRKSKSTMVSNFAFRSWSYSDIVPIKITTSKAIREKSQTTQISRISSRDHSIEIQTILRDTVTAAIFSCNVHWLHVGEGFPRTVECPHTDKKMTFITAIGNEIAIKDADVVIFAAGVNRSTWEKAMSARTSHQVWVYSTAESPATSPQVRGNIGGHSITQLEISNFNMSFTYHSKSEVVAPFGEYIPFKQKIASQRAKIAATHPRFKQMIAWVSSHCDLKSWNRTGFIHNLAEFIPIDIYGSCGTMPYLPWNKDGIHVLQRYKFYIAFENNCCSEYISEKFWKALAQFHLVPIVVGASKADYERVAPPNSYIFADDFESVRALARYIRTVAANTSLYNQYHEWRLKGEAVFHGSIRVHPFSSTEGACALLNFLEENAWKENQALRIRIDPFGPEWLGSCGLCGKHDWMTAYDISSNSYHPEVQTTVSNTSLYGESLFHVLN